MDSNATKEQRVAVSAVPVRFILCPWSHTDFSLQDFARHCQEVQHLCSLSLG